MSIAACVGGNRFTGASLSQLSRAIKGEAAHNTQDGPGQKEGKSLRLRNANRAARDGRKGSKANTWSFSTFEVEVCRQGRAKWQFNII